MITITKERIELFIKNPLENGLTRSEQMEVARIALSLFESEAAQVVPEEMTPQQASRSYGGEVRGYRGGFNQCRSAMLHFSEPETDNTNQQFESLCRDNK